LILQDSEPFHITGLEKYLLEQDLTRRGLLGGSIQDALSVYRASGRLPHGTLGMCVFDDLRSGVETFVRKTRPLLKEPATEPLEAVLSLEGFFLRGKLDSLHREYLIQYRYARLTAKDRLRAWIFHLFLNAAAPPSYPKTTTVVGLDPKNSKEPVWLAVQLQPVAEAEDILKQLLASYREGLQQPIHFFSRTSWEFANRVIRQGKEPADALAKARDLWIGGDYSRGEIEDPYFQQCFRNTDPLDISFQELALGVFAPLMEHETPLREK
jgi:exodeoxyribonuclease V gamma subunit